MKSTASVWTLALAVWLTVLLDHTSADVFGSGENTFEIDFVTIGNPGNPPDTTGNPNPAGKVDYTYRIGKYEISEQMIAKANTLGGLGITILARGPDKPAWSVSWNEAARFVNWLNTSKAFSPAYKFAFQPGDVGYSANANVLLWDPGDTGYNHANLFRNSQAFYFLPSVDEWYKAAYSDPTSSKYFNYPTGSDTAPTAVASGTATDTAVYNQSVPADTTLAGGLSPYGTVGQGGNVWEWEETERDLVNDSSSSARGVRGGVWLSSSSDRLLSSVRGSGIPTLESSPVGFRVASIPEPSTLLLAALGAAGLLLWRRSFTQSKRTRHAALLWAALLMPSVAHAVTIETVPVGNPGNAPDMRYNLEGYGSVPYSYRIGKYEVTAGQYTEFLNAVAADDTYGLYNEYMDYDANPDAQGCNIKRTGDPGSYTYSVAPDWSDRPVNWVDFWDAARFANWLHNGQPAGPQRPGSTEDGAYHDVGYQSLFGRNRGARFFIPTEDEWYKAAYHDVSTGLAGNYFDYPTKTDTVPGNDQRESGNRGNNANYYVFPPGEYAIGRPYWRSEVGEFELSDSPYGTFDQGGNVWEWNETALFDRFRVLRGGSFGDGSGGLHASNRDYHIIPSFTNLVIGFRIATIPEPGSITLVVCGAVAGLIWWQRQK